ncbi:MAG: hypothetical protein R3E32_22195 [Chitinophagales bacterium]
MNIYKLIFICGVLTLTSCDIPGYLDVKNCTKSDAYYLTYSQTAEGIKDTIIIEIPPNQTKGMLFGFGQHWTDDGIRDYLSQVNKIEIITSKDTISMTDKKEMYLYFQKRRKGLFKQILKIKVE